MELKKRTVKYYESVMEKSIVHSESTDMIVSDAYPDFERIISAVGNVYIKDKTAQNGRVLISGVARVTALCMPEDGSKIHRIEVPVNFAHIEEGNFITQNSLVSVEANVRNVEPRMANPRKISARVNIMLKISVFEASEKEICFDIASDENERLQVLKNQYEASFATDVKEKSFTIIEDMDMDSMTASQELCGHKISMANEEVRVVKNKAIAKGNAMIRLMAMNPATFEFSSIDFKLPYSQILEMDGIDENCEISVTSCIKNADLVANEDASSGAKKLQCMIAVEIFAVAYSKQMISAVCDVYSTSYDTTLETMPCAFSYPCAKKERIVEINEIVPFDMQVKSIVDWNVALEAPEYCTEPEAGICTTAYITLLYKNEAGELVSGTKTLPVSLNDAYMRKDFSNCSCDYTSFHATPTSDGTVSVMMSVLFVTTDKDCVKIPYIQKVELGHDRKKGGNCSLSLILTYLQRDESLWSIAKRYNTTAAEIADANGFSTEEKIPQGRMLLIPVDR